MGKARKITAGDRKYLAKALKDKKPYTEMAVRMNVCVDTLKRILQREGLAEFDAAKYAASMSYEEPVMWERPCMKCRDATPRPKWQYICDRCTERNKNYDGVDEEWLWDD